MAEDFFPPPPPPRMPEPPPVQPEWTGPPSGVLPGAVALELVIGQSDRAAAYLGRCAAYPTGLEFDLHVIAAAAADLDPSLNGIYHRPGRGSTYESMLRFGVQFADGRKASNVGGHRGPGDEPSGLVLWGRGGSGGDGRWQHSFWLWPLPPDGPLAFVCEWPAAGIPLTRVETDSQTLREAADRARPLFPSQTSPAPGGTWTSTSLGPSAPGQ